MEAGRELDALIAQRVMGWVWKRGEHWDITSVPGDRQLHLLGADDEIRQQRPGEFTSIGDWPPEDGRIIWSHLPHYSTDIAAALEVFMHFTEIYKVLAHAPRRSLGWTLGQPFIWSCTIGATNTVEADTAPLAICLAALKAVKP